MEASVAYFLQFLLGHPFQNGNKRMAVLFTHAFLLMNNLDFEISHQDLMRIAIEAIEVSQEESYEDLKQGLSLVFGENIKKYS